MVLPPSAADRQGCLQVNKTFLALIKWVSLAISAADNSMILALFNYPAWINTSHFYFRFIRFYLIPK
jgi:hypothetical protein